MDEFILKELPENFRKLAPVCVSKQLEALNRLFGRVFASIIHDIRGPMSTMVSMMEMLDASPFGQDNAEIIHEVKMQVDSAFCQVERLFGWLNYRNHNAVGMDVAAIIKAVFTEINLQAESIQTFSTDRDAIVLGFTDELPKGFLERLFRQAVKMPGCGGWISVQVLQSAQEAVVSVKDTGIRIDPDKTRSVFEWIWKERFGTPDDKEASWGCLITQDSLEQESDKAKFDNPGNTLYYLAVPVKNEKVTE